MCLLFYVLGYLTKVRWGWGRWDFVNLDKNTCEFVDFKTLINILLYQNYTMMQH